MVRFDFGEWKERKEKEKEKAERIKRLLLFP